MPGLMFQDVVCPRAQARRKWYTLPLSFLVHTSVLAVLIVVPLVATDSLPKPRAMMMEFVTPFVPVVPPPTPPIRRVAPSPAARGTIGAPVVAPDIVGVEPGVIFQPGDVATTGVDGIVGGFDVGQIAVDVLPPGPAVAPAPVVVGGRIKPPTRTKYVMPEYPKIASATWIQGIVIIEAVIGIDGRVEQTRVLRSHPLLEQAALTAVKAWEYTPTLLNGRPTPVIMTVTVHFSLK
jgi:TonB family protein